MRQCQQGQIAGNPEKKPCPGPFLVDSAPVSSQVYWQHVTYSIEQWYISIDVWVKIAAEVPPFPPSSEYKGKRGNYCPLPLCADGNEPWKEELLLLLSSLPGQQAFSKSPLHFSGQWMRIRRDITMQISWPRDLLSSSFPFPFG